MSLLVAISSYARAAEPVIAGDLYDPATQMSGQNDPHLNITPTDSSSTSNYGRDDDRDDQDQD